jgi:hypothetical protein
VSLSEACCCGEVILKHKLLMFQEQVITKRYQRINSFWLCFVVSVKEVPMHFRKINYKPTNRSETSKHKYNHTSCNVFNMLVNLCFEKTIRVHAFRSFWGVG